MGGPGFRGDRGRSDSVLLDRRRSRTAAWLPASQRQERVARILGSLQIPGFNIRWCSSDVTFSPDGNLAYIFSENSVTMNGADGSRPRSGKVAALCSRFTRQEKRSALRGQRVGIVSPVLLPGPANARCITLAVADARTFILNRL